MLSDIRCFRGFFMGGFECSTHRLPTGRRLDVIAASEHDRFARQDYQRLIDAGLLTARDGIRWHLIERQAGRYDFGSVRPMLDAARETGIEVIWDLLHYGWPDHIDVFSEDFIVRFAEFSRAFANLAVRQIAGTFWVVPINEISFLSWGAGEVGFLNPFARGQGDRLKSQLVRASIASIRAMREVAPALRLVHTDPMINVVAHPQRPHERGAAAAHHAAQFEALDMIAGRARPELGGSDDLIDVIGVNYYIHNQWVFPGGHGKTIEPSNPRYRRVSSLLHDYHARYRRPLFVAETGIEDSARPAWFRYISQEVRDAIAAGVPVEGLCLYPIVNHPGWDDDRHCYNGLWDYADARGHREPYAPLMAELRVQQQLYSPQDPSHLSGTDTALLDVASQWMEIRSGRADILHRDD